ncbi:DNA cytosine methyltransferase [Streptomyces virginiae]|uniref:DNA cytosine methyltransferase n=1 Tax=Streptomyces virginiae TaxID=1961 RepID=UPI0036E986E4
MDGGETMLTLATRDSAGVLTPADTTPEQALSVEDCHFRMLQPREQLAAQRFPGDYIMRGNKTEHTQQAGNAVSCNVASGSAPESPPPPDLSAIAVNHLPSGGAAGLPHPPPGPHGGTP